RSDKLECLKHSSVIRPGACKWHDSCAILFQKPGRSQFLDHNPMTAMAGRAAALDPARRSFGYPLDRIDLNALSIRVSMVAVKQTLLHGLFLAVRAEVLRLLFTNRG